MAMTAPFIPPRPISAMITTRPRVSAGRRSLALRSAVIACRTVGGDAAVALAKRGVQVAQGLVVVGAPVEPLVERLDVDGGGQLVAQLSRVGDDRVGVVEDRERLGVVGATPLRGGIQCRFVVLASRVDIRAAAADPVARRAHSSSRSRVSARAATRQGVPFAHRRTEPVLGGRRADERDRREGLGDGGGPLLDVGDESVAGRERRRRLVLVVRGERRQRAAGLARRGRRAAPRPPRGRP